jgi:hypothetical protein
MQSPEGGFFCQPRSLPVSVDTAAANTPTSYQADKTDAAYNTIMAKVMSLFAWLVGVAAITLDNSVYYTVVKMGSYVNQLDAVGVTWRILRDIGNIMLIFGFLAAGIATILNIEMYGWGKKMLPMLLVGAVFINFSLFITEAIIDTGNLFATQFYTQINGGPAGVKDFDKGAITVSNEGISNKIMGQLGLQTIYGNGKARTEIFDRGNPWIIGFMAIILFIVTAFVMFSLAFILIARFVILLFLIILAPVGFAGLAVPKLAKRAGQWWDALFEQTITAPVLLLLLYIALAVITDAKFLAGFNSSSNPDWVGFASNNLTGFASVFLSFLVAMGLLLAVVIASKKMSAFGAGWASSAAGKLTFGATAWAGRTTVGWGASRAAKALRGTALARVPLIGTGAVRGLERVATGSFDVRGVAMGGGLKGIGVEAGTAQKGGYRADLKGRIESRTKYASELTGEKLTDQETADVAVIENRIAEMRKSQKGKTATQVMEINEQIKVQEKEIEKLEENTDKGAKRKYASNLQLGYLGLDEKAFFNKYINFAANTEAAKKIKEDAKKSKDDKELDMLRKALKKAGGEEESEKPKGGEEKPKEGGKPETESKPETGKK